MICLAPKSHISHIVIWCDKSLYTNFQVKTPMGSGRASLLFFYKVAYIVKILKNHFLSINVYLMLILCDLLLWLCSVCQNTSFDTHIDVVAIYCTMPPYPTISPDLAILATLRSKGIWLTIVSPSGEMNAPYGHNKRIFKKKTFRTKLPNWTFSQIIFRTEHT